MSGLGDDQREMEHFPKLRDSDVEALIAGRHATGAEHLDDLARFVTTAKAVLPEALDPAVEQRHLAVLVEAAHLIEPSGSGHTASKRRSRTMLSTLFASLWMKVAAVVVTALAATGGLAAANELGPAQDTVASVGDAFGLDLPSSHDDATEVEDADDATEVESDDADDDANEVESDDADETVEESSEED